LKVDQRNTRPRGGVTLLELMVGVALIASVASFAVP
jgi:prepilin-type N-terminal cleavage/methylation domain-containing protein